MSYKLLCGLLGLFLFLGVAGPVAPARGASPLGVSLQDVGLAGPAPVEVRYDENPIPVHVDPPAARPAGLGLQSTSFIIDYVPAGTYNDMGDLCMDFPAEAKPAVAAAAAIWAGLINSTVPIRIETCWAALGPSVLGHARGMTYISNWGSGNPPPAANVWYQVSLANAIAGVDLYPVPATKPVGCTNLTCPDSNWDDLTMAFANGFAGSFYYGTDGNPGAKTDLESVILHEVTHALGFAGSMSKSGTVVGWGGGTPYPFTYDRFTVDGFGVNLIDTGTYPNPSAELLTALTSGDIYFAGPIAAAANGGSDPALYAPVTYSGGSTYSHLAESFNGTANALMTYSIGPGESIHAPGPVGMGVLNDVGWKYLATPDGLVLSQPPGTNSVRLDWSDRASDESGFLIERSLNDTAHWTTVTTTAANAVTYTDSPLSPGTVYYRVSTVFAGPFTTASTTPASLVVTAALAAPGTLVATPASSTQINLAWSDTNTAESGYKIERSADGSSGWSTVTTTAANAVSYNHTGLAENTRVYYRVTAVNGGISSAPAAATAITPLLAPSGAAGTAVSGTRVNLTWTDNSLAETGYKVQRSATGGDPWTDLTPTPLAAGSSAYSDTTAAEKTAYTYRVWAVNAGSGTVSAANATAVINTLLNTPGNFTASPPLGGGKVLIQWADNSAFETGYLLQYSTTGAAGPWTTLSGAALPAGSTSYLWTGVANGTYFFQVRANGSPNSAWAAASATLNTRWVFVPLVKH